RLAAQRREGGNLTWTQAHSIYELAVRTPRHFAPLVNFRLEVGGDLLRSAADNLRAEAVKSLRHIRHLENADDLRMQTLYHGRRGAGRHHHPAPRVCLKTGNTSFVHGWQIRHRTKALRTCNRERAQPARSNVR